jgi:hypothetical protein
MKMWSLLKPACLVIGLVAALALFASPSRADTIYTYTGAPFTSFFDTTCPPTCSITGHFTVTAPLGSGISGLPNFTPESFSFTDGVTTWTNLNSTFYVQFEVDTNTSGAISAWDINLIGPGSGGGLFTYYVGPGTLQEGTNVDTYEAFATDGGLPGTWTQASSVPEPSSFSLLCLGMLGAFGLSWRRVFA